MNSNLHLKDSWSTELLDEVTLEAQSFLTTFAKNEAFSTNITLTFSNLVDTEILEGLRQQWSLDNFDKLSIIEILSDSEINEVNSAFASATSTIYLSSVGTKCRNYFSRCQRTTVIFYLYSIIRN